MSFEHKEYIEQFLGVHDEDAQRELEQVYAMAEAFDEMKVKYEENLNYVKGLTEEGLEGSVFHEIVLGASVINYFRESEESE